MTTHELARLLLAQPDLFLLINDEVIDAPSFEESVFDDGTEDGKPAIMLWTRE